MAPLDVEKVPDGQEIAGNIAPGGQYPPDVEVQGPLPPPVFKFKFKFKFVRSTSKTAGHNFKKTEHNYS